MNRKEFSHGSYTARGVAMLIPSDMEIVSNDLIRDNTGMLLTLNSTFEGQSSILATI